MLKQEGFSLIELLIVVAIILIIAAIVVPSLTRSRVAADESSAVGSLRSINSAEISYNAAYPAIGFTTTLANLGGPAGSACTPTPATGCFIDNVLSTGSKSGYSFQLAANSGGTSIPQMNYSVVAIPQTFSYTGARYFCTFEDGVVRYSSGALSNPCSATVTPIQ